MSAQTSKNDMTQREWDRIVGIGQVPKQGKPWNGKWTNHKSTWDRHPDNKDEQK